MDQYIEYAYKCFLDEISPIYLILFKLPTYKPQELVPRKIFFKNFNQNHPNMPRQTLEDKAHAEIARAIAHEYHCDELAAKYIPHFLKIWSNNKRRL